MEQSVRKMQTSLRREYNRRLMKRQFNKFMENKLSVIGTAIMLIILLACIIYPFVAAHDYKQIDLATGAVAQRARICSAPTASAATSSPAA